LWIRKIGFRAVSNRAGEVEAPVNCRNKQEVTKPVDSAPLAAMWALPTVSVKWVPEKRVVAERVAIKPGMWQQYSK
jgi:hypothetical protein